MIDKLSADIKEAMKAKDKAKVTALRYLKSMLMENKVSKKPKEEMDVVISHYKKLNDSLENFPDGSTLKTDTQNEMKVIEAYMPKQLSEDDVKNIIKEIISSNEGINFGLVMKELSPKIKGQFDGKKASQLVKEILG